MSFVPGTRLGNDEIVAPPGWRFSSVVLRGAIAFSLVLLVASTVAALAAPRLEYLPSCIADALQSDTVAVHPPASPDSTSLPMEVEPEPARPVRDPLALRGHGRPNLVTSLRQAATAGVSDLLYLYTTPLRMSRRNVLEASAVVGTGVAFYALDSEIEGGFRRSRENELYRSIVVDAGGAVEPLGLIARTNGWLAGATVAGWAFDVPLLRTIPVEMLESNILVGTLRQPFQRLVGRARPSDHVGPRSFGKGGRSFPSGHASVVCEYASILSYHFRRPAARAAIWSVAGLVCLQRIDDPGKSHWPSDVWLGAALGTYSGHTLARRNDERRRGVSQRPWYDVVHRSAAEWSLSPTIEPVGFACRTRF
jgi:membrane-associated phospholipid phosphatase